MKITLFIFQCILPIILFGQNINPHEQEVAYIEFQRTTLVQQKQAYQDSIKQIEQRVTALDKQIEEVRIRAQVIVNKYADLNNAIGTGVTVKAPKPVNLCKTIDPTEGWIEFIPKNGKMTILHIDAYPYYKVQYGSKVGYIAAENLPLKGSRIYDLDYDLSTTLNLATSKYYYTAPSATPSQYTPSPQPNSSSSYTPSTRSSASDQTIHTGPRGGRYHYSASGKKVYEKKH